MKILEKKINLITAGLFFALAAYFIILNVNALCITEISTELLTSFSYINKMFSAFLIGVGYVLIALMILMKKAKPLLILGFIICLIVNVVSSVLYQAIELTTYNSVAYLAVISRSRITVPFNAYFGEVLSLMLMILLVLLIGLLPANNSNRIRKFWFVPGAMKGIYVFIAMINTIRTMNYFGIRAEDLGSYMLWNIYSFVIIAAYLLAGLWIAKNAAAKQH